MDLFLIRLTSASVRAPVWADGAVAAGSACVGRINVDSFFSTRSARRASFVVTFRNVSIQPVLPSRAMMSKRSAGPRYTCGSCRDRLGSVVAFSLQLCLLPFPKRPRWLLRGRDFDVEAGFAGLVAGGLYKRTTTAVEPPLR